MNRNFFSLFVAVNFLVVGGLQSTPMQTPTPTPTPKPGLKIKSMVVTTPTPTAPPKRIKGAVVSPTSTPIRIDKGTKTGPGPTPIKIGKDQIKAEPSRAPIKVIKTQVSTPTPTVPPIKVIKTQLSTPTPTPSRKIKDQVTSSTTPIRIPKDGVTGGGGRPGPINLSGPTPGSKKLTPGQNNLPPAPVRTLGTSNSAPPPGSKRLIPGQNNLPPDPVKNLGADNSVSPPPPPPNTGIGNQNPNPIVNGETPLGGNTGTAQGTAPTPKKPINHELRIYTMNGHGTSSTNLGGDIQSAKLDVYANVDKEFTLRWARPTAGGEEKGNLYVVPKNSDGSVWLGVQSVTMPAGSITVNIPYTLPHLEPNTYELNIVGDNGNSNNVTVNYSGEGSDEPSAIKLPTPQDIGAKLKVSSQLFGSTKFPGGSEVSAQLTRKSDGAGIDGREVSYTVNGKPVGTATTAGGWARLAFPAPEPRPDALKVDVAFAGDNLYLPATDSLTFPLPPEKTQAYIMMVSAPAGVVGQTLSFQAKLSLTTSPYGNLPGFDFSNQKMRFIFEYIDSWSGKLESFSAEGTTGTDGIATASVKPRATCKSLRVRLESSKWKADDLTTSVQIGPANVELVLDPVAGNIGQTVTLRAHATRTSDNSALSGVEVKFDLVGGQSLGKAKPDASGEATLAVKLTSGMGIGAHEIQITTPKTDQYNAGSGKGTIQIGPSQQ
jgi:hypothetical protein